MTAPRTISATTRAFLSLICAIVWLLVVPVFFLKGFRKALRSPRDDGGECADWSRNSPH